MRGDDGSLFGGVGQSGGNERTLCPISFQPRFSIAYGDILSLFEASKRQYKCQLSDIDPPESLQPFGNRSQETPSACAWQPPVLTEGYSVAVSGKPFATVVVVCVEYHLCQVQLGMAWQHMKHASERPKSNAFNQDYAWTSGDIDGAVCDLVGRCRRTGQSEGYLILLLDNLGSTFWVHRT